MIQGKVNGAPFTVDNGRVYANDVNVKRLIESLNGYVYNPLTKAHSYRMMGDAVSDMDAYLLISQLAETTTTLRVTVEQPQELKRLEDPQRGAEL